MKNVETACNQIAQLVRHGYQLVITHGNGPQVGNLAIQQEAAADQVPSQPLVVLGAMTQGQIGYMMQQQLHNILDGDGKDVATIVTQVLVSPEDPDFKDPTKPVGPFYTEEIAKKLGVSRQSVNELVRERRAVSPEMALRLGRLFGNSPAFWLNLQRAVDLYDTAAATQDEVRHITPLRVA